MRLLQSEVSKIVMVVMECDLRIGSYDNISIYTYAEME